jgi:hypothetical protein
VGRIGRSIDNNAYGQYLIDLVRRREEALVQSRKTGQHRGSKSFQMNV